MPKHDEARAAATFAVPGPRRANYLRLADRERVADFRAPPDLRAVERFAVLRLAVLRLAVLRFAVDRLAVERLAVLRFAVLRLAVERLAVLRFFAVPRFAVLRFAVLRLAVLRLAVLRFFAVPRFAVLRLAVLRLAVLRFFAVPRFAVLRFAVLRFAVDRLAVERFAEVFLFDEDFLAEDFLAPDFFAEALREEDEREELLELRELERDEERVAAGMADTPSALSMLVVPHVSSAASAVGESLNEPEIDVCDVPSVPLQSSWVINDLLSRIARARFPTTFVSNVQRGQTSSCARC